MTTKELNRDIKRLHKSISNADMLDEKIKQEHRKEFMRLYLADKEFSYINAENIKIMLRLNLRYRFEPLHLFGIYINY